MKKLLLILAIVAVYGFSISGVNASVVHVEKSKVTIVANDKAPDGEKVKKADAKTEAGCASKADAKTEAGCAGKAEAKTGCSEQQKAACAEKGKACCGSKEAVPVPQKK